MRDTRVDAYLDAAPDWQREIMERVRDLLHEADPEIEETIKRRSSRTSSCRATSRRSSKAKDHVTVFLYDGGLRPTPRGSSPAATATRPAG